MTIKELKAIKKRIKLLRLQLELPKSAADSTTANITATPHSKSTISDKVGRNTANMADLQDELQQLTAEYNDAINRLSYDVDEENCIYLFLVRRYTWRRIAQIADDRFDTANAIKKRCERHEW